jgi:16S rRNA (uracil1498-N3)-methyltransferase
MRGAAGPRLGAGGVLRLFVGGTALAPAAELDLPAAAATHVKVRRLQPGAPLLLFDGESGDDWPAAVLALARGGVRARLGDMPQPAPAPELPLAVTLAFGMPANERIDALVEKATELGAIALVPLMSERSVLRLAGERALRRQAHWQAVAAAACEQCGRARVPLVHPVQSLAAWLSSSPRPTAAQAGSAVDAQRWLLSTDASAPAFARAWHAARPIRSRDTPRADAAVFLSGPEGGLAPAEEAAACAAGYAPVSLGSRVLRADTAPLAAMAWLALSVDATARAGEVLQD